MSMFFFDGKITKFPIAYRFILIGSFGTLIGWIFYFLIYSTLSDIDNKATISWIITYLIGTIFQHYLHYRVTFSESKVTYLNSLGGAFVSYTAGLIGTSAINWFLIEYLDIFHHLAWIVTVILGSLMNYFLLRNISFKHK